MAIVLVGLNHKSAPLEVREKVSLSKPKILQIADDIKGCPSISGCAILSTCNRTEFYFNTSDKAVGMAEIGQIIEQKSGLAIEKIDPFLYKEYDYKAVDHLFSVAAGLDSMILGESQIQGQVQDAYEIALDTGMSDSIINTLFMNALTVGKRVRTETQIDRQAVSISSAAVELAKNIFNSLDDKEVLVLGAGETSELTARHLVSNGIKSILVANRTYERAYHLASEFDGEAIRLDDLPKHIDQTDIIISSTASPKYLLTKDNLEPYLKDRKKTLLLIDIAVPRDIEPALSELENVLVYDIDDLQNVVTTNLNYRKQEAIEARKIVDEELDDFFFWLDSLWVVPTIVKMREQINEIKNSEIERAKNKIENITDREERIIENLANRIVNQWLHKPIINMKILAGKKINEIDCYVRAIHDLWDLGEEESDVEQSD